MNRPLKDTYCAFREHPIHGPYHDQEYGFPVEDDRILFERMVLEINQAGLSWLTILKKRDALYRAFEGYDLARIACYQDADRARLLSDAGIIRNRMKIDAVIENALKVCLIQDEFGSFSAWLDFHHPRGKDAWVQLFRRTFRFVGGEIVGEFLVSTGYLPGAHHPDCPISVEIRKLSPPWMRGKRTVGRVGRD